MLGTFLKTCFWWLKKGFITPGWEMDKKTEKILYNNLKKFIKDIPNIWQIFLRQASLRFWLLRLSAICLPKKSNIKTVNNPKEYEIRVLFHRENKIKFISDYSF